MLGQGSALIRKGSWGSIVPKGRDGELRNSTQAMSKSSVECTGSFVEIGYENFYVSGTGKFLEFSKCSCRRNVPLPPIANIISPKFLKNSKCWPMANYILMGGAQGSWGGYSTADVVSMPPPHTLSLISASMVSIFDMLFTWCSRECSKFWGEETHHETRNMSLAEICRGV